MADLERIALFIDGANLYATAKSLGFDIDYKRLLKEFQSRGKLIRAFYYTALIEDQEYSSIRPLIDWLDYNGFAVVTKPTKEFVDALGRRKVKGNMDIELAVDAMEMADHLDHIVLFSGDGDFRSLVEAVQRKGVRVSVVSTNTTQPAMIADELRRQADEFIDLVSLVSKIGRDPGERTQRYQDRRSSPVAAGQTFDQSERTGLSTPLDPGPDCPLCPRLAEFRAAARSAEPGWFNSPVPSFGGPDARLLIVGLAPGLRGANRTGRPFTGDYAGDLLYATLLDFGFARGLYDRRPDDGLVLVGCTLTNAVRCVPPQNKPLPEEIRTCRRFLDATLAHGRFDAIVALGRIAHESVVRVCGSRIAAAPFGHGRCHPLVTPAGRPVALFDSYHCSRYNTNTGVLTTAMFRDVFQAVRGHIDQAVRQPDQDVRQDQDMRQPLEERNRHLDHG